MRVSVGFDRKRRYDGRLHVSQMNPATLCIRIGQRITMNDEENGKRTAVIKKLYKNHALCLINGRFYESYTYNELACLGLKKMMDEALYSKLTRGEREVFELSVDYGMPDTSELIERMRKEVNERTDSRCNSSHKRADRFVAAVKIDLMHQVFGYGNGQCKDCQYFRSRNAGNRKVFKCAVYGETGSEASDWRKKYKACGCQYRVHEGEPIMNMVSQKKERMIDGQITLGGNQ